MKLLEPAETEIVGNWVLVDRHVERDEACERVHWLIEHSFDQLAYDPQWGLWETLFRDRTDGRYWERTYLQGEMHGGGPPSLRCLTAAEASKKYGITLDE